MIEIIDSEGKVVARLSEAQFPLKVSSKQKWGKLVYRLWLNFTHLGDEKQIKSMNLAK